MPCLLLTVRLLFFLFGYSYDESHNLYNLLLYLKLRCINMDLSTMFNCKLHFYVLLWILQYAIFHTVSADGARIKAAIN